MKRYTLHLTGDSDAEMMDSDGLAFEVEGGDSFDVERVLAANALALQRKLDEAVRLIEMRVDARHRPKPSGWAKQWTKNAEKWLATLGSEEASDAE